MANNAFSNAFEDAFEQGVSTTKQQVVQQVKQAPQSVASQLGISTGDPQTQVADVAAQHDQFNETATKQAQTDPAVVKAANNQLVAKDSQDRQQKLADTRKKLNQLHKQMYYDPTFNRPTQEPTVQDRLQQEEQVEQQKKMVELEEKKKKDEPIALARAKRTAEMNRGVSG